jgi:hypothetical protein
MGVKQPAIAKMERQKDMKLSTLHQLITSFGGSLQLRVKLPKKSKAIVIHYGQ